MSDFFACFSRHDYKCLSAVFKMYEQQKMMFEQDVRTCANRIISIYQSHLRPIVRGKAKYTFSMFSALLSESAC